VAEVLGPPDGTGPMTNRGRDVPLQDAWPPPRTMVVFDEADQLVLRLDFWLGARAAMSWRPRCSVFVIPTVPCSPMRSPLRIKMKS
jgi:hypothetical protein